MLVNFNLEGLEEKDVREIKYLLQTINDKFESGITTRNLSNFMNTYVINEKDSLDATHPMYVHFNIINEMVKIISVNVSFWILDYRAYSTAAASGGAVSSASGGGETPTSSSVSTPSGGGSTSGATGSASGGGSTSGSGGGQTSSAGGGQTTSVDSYGTALGYLPTAAPSYSANIGDANINGFVITTSIAYYLSTKNHTHTVANHTHTVANHSHSTPNHTHPNHTHSTPAHTHPNHTHTVTIAAHTHTGGAHTHDITYGIHEEENSPTIKFYISDTGEENYSNTFFGGYTADKANINITDYITSVGSKMIKFTSTTRTRLSVQIEVKLAITA